MLDGLQRLQSDDGGSPTQGRVFLGHAKADVPDEEAESLVHGLADRMQGTNSGLEAYLDETRALSGWSWRSQFQQADRRRRSNRRRR